METKINIEQIAVIRLKGFTNDRYYKYVHKPKKTFLGFTMSEEVKGISGGAFLPFYETAEEYLKENGHWNVIKDNKLLVKPSIEMEMSNNETYSKYFNSIAERDKYYEKHLKHLNLLAL